jgi:hypothetical protein
MGGAGLRRGLLTRSLSFTVFALEDGVSDDLGATFSASPLAAVETLGCLLESWDSIGPDREACDCLRPVVLEPVTEGCLSPWKFRKRDGPRPTGLIVVELPDDLPSLNGATSPLTEPSHSLRRAEAMPF